MDACKPDREATIVNPLGLHARPAAQLVRLAAGFTSDVRLAKDDMEVNGKSIMGVMMLAAECGSTVRVRADGVDEADAVAAICTLIAEGFGES
jgi:phosphocarrier protein